MTDLERQLIDEMNHIAEALEVIASRMYDGKTMTYDERRDIAFKLGRYAEILKNTEVRGQA